MRMLRACVAGALLWAAGGCSSDGDVVSLTFDQRSADLSPVITDFHASSATAVVAADSTNLVAKSSAGMLTVFVLGSLVANTTVTFGQDSSVSFDVASGGWSSTGGSMIVDGTNPYRVRFQGVTMIRGAPPVTGSFVINGSGTFK